MKKFLIFGLLVFSLMAFAEKVVISVPGMVCQMCVQGMQKAFRNAVKDPDKDIVVDLDTKTVTLNLKTALTDKQIKERVKGTGYNAKKIDRSIDSSK